MDENLASVLRIEQDFRCSFEQKKHIRRTGASFQQGTIRGRSHHAKALHDLHSECVRDTRQEWELNVPG
jgi:hypothetical protein